MPLHFPSATGIVAELMRARDWSKTSLGPIESWPLSLKTMVGVILHSSFPSYLVWGPERIFIYNDAYLPLIGSIKHPDGLGQRFEDVWPEEWPELAKLMAKVDLGQSFSFQDHMLALERKGFKEEAYFTFSFSPILDESNQVGGILCNYFETTSRVQLESELKQSREELHTALGASPAILWITEPEGACTYLSDQWHAFTGQSSEEAKGFGWLFAIHPDDREETKETFIRANDGRESFSIEYRLRTTDDNYRWAISSGNPRFDDQGKFLGYAGTVFDIHDRIATENALKELQERFKKSVAATEIGVWYCDLPFFEMIWSAEVKRHFFLSPDDRVTLDTFYERIHPEDRDRTRNAIETSIATRTPYDTIYRTTCPNGSGAIKYIRAIGWTDYSPSGVAIRFDGITLDVSADLQKTRDLESAKEEAIRANELKSAFLANMSHEIRTPLGAMIGFADLLRDPGLTPSERASYIDILARNGEQLSVIINDILDLSKVEAGHLTLEYSDVDPRHVVADVMSLLRVKAKEKGLVLDYFEEETAPASIVSDPTRVRQVLLNLVGNALKFTSFGSVKIRSFGCKNDSGRDSICLEISDTGIGVSEDQREKVFEMFVQADGSMTRRFGGTGLGLALSRKLARSLGGEVSITHSEVGKGTTFLFVVEDQPERRNVKATDLEPRRSSTKEFRSNALEKLNILVVDDSPDNRQLIWRYLTKHGATIDSAENGWLGFKKALAGNFDLVLMDIQMPEMDGYSATHKLRSAGYRKPIIALTAHAMNEVRQKCLNVGCSGHLTKPIEPQELISAIVEQTSN